MGPVQAMFFQDLLVILVVEWEFGCDLMNHDKIRTHNDLTTRTFTPHRLPMFTIEITHMEA